MISMLLLWIFLASPISSEIIVSNIAGTNIYSSSGDGGIASAATFKLPYGIYCATTRDIYIADSDDNRIRKISAASNIISTYTGTGFAGYNGDNIQATSAYINYPGFVTIDETNGLLYISEMYRVRKVSLSTGIISTTLGSGSSTCSLNSVSATAAGLSATVRQIYASTDASIYVSILDCNQVVKVSNGIVYTIAGTGTSSYNGDNIPATSASLMKPAGLWVTTGGQILISESDGQRI
eukprot:gene18723-26480_t